MSAAEKKKCLFRACPCNDYLGTGFVRSFFETSQAMEQRRKIYIDICTRWCSTGVKPPGVIESSNAQRVALAQSPQIP